MGGWVPTTEIFGAEGHGDVAGFAWRQGNSLESTQQAGRFTRGRGEAEVELGYFGAGARTRVAQGELDFNSAGRSGLRRLRFE
jgi:hypothetical protein